LAAITPLPDRSSPSHHCKPPALLHHCTRRAEPARVDLPPLETPRRRTPLREAARASPVPFSRENISPQTDLRRL
jgi:hypothetical protein